MGINARVYDCMCMECGLQRWHIFMFSVVSNISSLLYVWAKQEKHTQRDKEVAAESEGQ